MLEINADLVKMLLIDQFPHWAHLEVRPVANSGHDNRTFHIGDHMTARLPSAQCYASQVEKEQKWLPILGDYLSLPIQKPIAKGKPTSFYPMNWSINTWIPGEPALTANLKNKDPFARGLAAFLLDLQSADPTDGPLAGEQNFYRGGDLVVYHHETIQAFKQYEHLLPTDTLTLIWKRALSTKWEKPPVWIHGDIAPGNLLVQGERLCAVIDFGIMGIGDPACDLAIAWTFFDSDSRAIFKKALRTDDHTWDRAKGWALWKALITYDGNQSSHAHKVINEILDETC